MEFSDTIKQVRKEKGMTQEQFANCLHVSRQAVSNWENNKNLPDIEMLITISETFEISLDQLLKGKDDSKIRQKIIEDGSETRRSRYNTICAVIGLVLFVLGLLCFVIKMNTVEYMDEAGVVHENFFLVIWGFAFFFAGIVTYLSMGIRRLVQLIRKK